jgi:hypothetical protein
VGAGTIAGKVGSRHMAQSRRSRGGSKEEMQGKPLPAVRKARRRRIGSTAMVGKQRCMAYAGSRNGAWEEEWRACRGSSRFIATG